MGKALDLPVHALLGGKLRDAVEFAAYLFFRYPDAESGEGEVRTVEQLVEEGRRLKASFAPPSPRRTTPRPTPCSQAPRRALNGTIRCHDGRPESEAKGPPAFLCSLRVS